MDWRVVRRLGGKRRLILRLATLGMNFSLLKSVGMLMRQEALRAITRRSSQSFAGSSRRRQRFIRALIFRSGRKVGRCQDTRFTFARYALAPWLWSGTKIICRWCTLANEQRSVRL